MRAQPGLVDAKLARGTFVSRPAMHHLLGSPRGAGPVRGVGAGRFRGFTLTPAGKAHPPGASAAAAAVEERMLVGFTPGWRRQFYADLTSGADTLS